MKLINKKTVFLCGVFALLTLNSCINDTDESAGRINPTSTQPGTSSYMINDVDGAVIMKTWSDGELTMVDTIESEDSFEAGKVIMKVTSSMLTMYEKGEDTTFTLTFPKEQTLLGGVMGSQESYVAVLEQQGFSNVEIVQYDIAENQTEITTEKLTMTSDYTIHFKATIMDMPIESYIDCDMQLLGDPYTGQIPPADWPQTVVESGTTTSRAGATAPFLK